MKGLLKVLALICYAIILIPPSIPASACTGIRLTASDGTVVYGRSMEWGSFDLRSRIVVFPRGYEFIGETPDGKPGFSWRAKYGVVGLDMLEKDALADGINEKGLTCGLFYHPGFAQYAKYDPSRAAESIGPADVAQFILSRFGTVEEVRGGIKEISVVPVDEPALGFPPPAHFVVSGPGGKSIVIEFSGGKAKIFDNPLGVITNAPTFDWHITNLRNYVNLSAVAIPGKKIEDIDFKPLGGGSGMIGLPGDFTPPSRFIRAVAFSQTARKTTDGPDTVEELFRILDNFNLPLGSAEGSEHSTDNNEDRMKSSTIWTTAWDTRNLVLYYHTQHNRRLRKLDVKAIDFNSLGKDIVRIPLDRKKVQDIEVLTLKNAKN